MPVTLKFPVEPSERVHYKSFYTADSNIYGIKINSYNLKHSDVFNKIHVRSGNGFIDAIYNAYNHHKKLIITPDMLWTTILTSLMSYVDANAEKLRHNFVSHEGTKDITLRFGGNYASVSVERFAEMFIEQINANSNQSSDWLQCDFTTTTSRERTASSLIIMAGFQKYFKLNMICSCGIPEVQLMGEKSDYESIKIKINKIGLIGDDILNDWSLKLIPIITQFIAAFDDNSVDLHEDFWSKIMTSERYGSGSREFIDGWLATLCPFIESKSGLKYSPDQIDYNEVPLGYMVVPINVDDNGNKFDVNVYVGQIGYEYNNDTFNSRVDFIVSKINN